MALSSSARACGGMQTLRLEFNGVGGEVGTDRLMQALAGGASSGSATLYWGHDGRAGEGSCSHK